MCVCSCLPCVGNRPPRKSIKQNVAKQRHTQMQKASCSSDDMVKLSLFFLQNPPSSISTFPVKVYINLPLLPPQQIFKTVFLYSLYRTETLEKGLYKLDNDSLCICSTLFKNIIISLLTVEAAVLCYRRSNIYPQIHEDHNYFRCNFQKKGIVL